MRMRRANLFGFALSKDDTNVLFNFYRNENQFFACYTLIPHEWESYSKRPEIINVLPLNSKILGDSFVAFLFFFSIVSE